MSSKAFIVTGASRGLGLAIAQILIRASHKVFLVARSESGLQKIKSENPSNVEYLAADLADFSTSPKVIEAAVKAFGKVDGIVINHAVLTPLSKIADVDIEEWRRSYDINVASPLALVKAALPELRKTKGCIVFVSSGASVGAYTAWGAYGTAKAAINHLCAHLAVEEPAITSVAISPGKVDTDMQQQIRELGGGHMTDKDHASFIEEHASGKLLKPEQPGTVIANLVAGPPKEVNGKHLRWNDDQLKSFQA
ncbi:hypothetical protein PFICI_02335 [Pestalotiopsis fici W106-1]|uniref:Ketoreductase domain-containing protein n=1 Tax=Pestalotiopsis fici (strain W106-1 / CGMCC3.15140) TaxID=1229662 RepID=W3XE43_PESFW|nr:uncharacterized protein PFICI_02335 [Pestalotiopsis fici W106-1]ETS84310.1 hypothetical protein PFICI_02335 [Pestalotiopsis fici W106-1]